MPKKPTDKNQLSLFPPEIEAQFLSRFNLASSQELADWLQEKGYKIDRKVAVKYSNHFLSQLEQVVSYQQAAKAIELEPDESDRLPSALVLLAQTKLLRRLLRYDPDEDESPVNLENISRTIAQLNQSVLGMKKYEQQIKDAANKAAKEVSDAAKKGGMSDESIDFISENILGIVV